MHPDHTADNSVITTDYLVTLNEAQIADLLAHKTKLLVAACLSKIPDPVYINGLKVDVENLQEALKGKIF